MRLPKDLHFCSNSSCSSSRENCLCRQIYSAECPEREDIQKNYDIITINSQMTKVKEILNDLGIHKEVINCNKEKISDELVQSIYDYCNYPSKVLNKFMYKQWKKIFDKL